MKLEIKVKVVHSDVFTKKGTSRAGKPYEIREQTGYVDLGKAYPVEFKFSLEDDRPPYPPGEYVVDPNCIYVDRFGQLALGRIKLVPPTV